LRGVPSSRPATSSPRTFRLNDDEKRLYNAVTEYVERSYNRALAADKRNVAFALLILQRRLASSVRAVRRSLERRKARLEELLKLGRWLSEGRTLDEEELEDAPEVERLRQEEELLERLTAAETREELEREIHTLAELIRLAREAERHEVETKLNELRRVMEDERIRQTGEKILIFTESPGDPGIPGGEAHRVGLHRHPAPRGDEPGRAHPRRARVPGAHPGDGLHRGPAARASTSSSAP